MDAVEEPLPDEALPDETEDGIGAEDDSTDFEPEPAPEPEAVPAAATPAEPEVSEPAEAPVADTSADTVAASPAPEAPAWDEDEGEDEDEARGLPDSVEGMAPPKRDLDQNLRAILQEEVAREMAARAADTGETVIETPPVEAETETSAEDTPELELIREPSEPLDDDAFPEIGPAPTPERVDVFANAPDIAAAADKASRKDLFPDIEEINSTLDSHGMDDEDEDEIETEDRGGFRRAFFAVIAVAALLLALYLVAPKLAASVPALEPALSAYVGAINGLRGVFSGLI